MSFLSEDDVLELEALAGVRFPINGLPWPDLCYICLWIGMKRDLPEALNNRMMLGESNEWTSIYMRVLEKRKASGCDV